GCNHGRRRNARLRSSTQVRPYPAPTERHRLLASGKTHTEAAKLLGLSRTCISKWAAYDPDFQAALNQRRAEVWGEGVDLLRALIPKALGVLAGELDRADSPQRLRAALEILRLAGLPSPGDNIGPTDPEVIVREAADNHRERLQADYAADG